MRVEALELADFRNYRHALIELGPGCTVFVGPNGQGKTNLVEAVGYAAALRSHRVAGDAPLVRHGAAAATVRLRVRRGPRTASLDLQIAPGSAGAGTRVKLNGQALPRARDCLGLVRAVVFAPEDLALVKADPAIRRDYLDDLLVQRQPRWAGVRADVERVLRQRSALLRAVAKRGGRPDATDRSTLEVWDEQLARAGGELQAGRAALVADLGEPFAMSYRDVAGEQAAAALTYRPSGAAPGAAPGPGALAEALPVRHDEEFRRGVNLTGPHRDELEITLGGHPAKGFASHGESWSLALALRLSSYRLLAAESIDGGDPVLILDDVFAELDDGRRSRLAASVARAEQVLITAAVPQDVPAALAGTRIEVGAGVLTGPGCSLPGEQEGTRA